MWRDEQVARLRTFAVLIQRRESVAVERASLRRNLGREELTLDADQALFWKVYEELHPGSGGPLSPTEFRARPATTTPEPAA